MNSLLLHTVLKNAPYEVSEQGYAGFILPIEIYFRTNDPKKASFEYDMFLRLDDSVVNYRKEKMTFYNPNEEFKKKLIKGGGIVSRTFYSSCFRSI